MVQRFGEKLTMLRIRNRLTRQQLVEQLGLPSEKVLSEIERGRRHPSAGLVMKVADLFAVDPEQLLVDDEDVD